MSDLGVDLHSTSFTVCRLPKRGKGRVERYRLEDIDRFRQTLRRQDRVAVEATGNTRYFVERIRDRVREVQVKNQEKSGTQYYFFFLSLAVERT